MLVRWFRRWWFDKRGMWWPVGHAVCWGLIYGLVWAHWVYTGHCTNGHAGLGTVALLCGVFWAFRAVD